MRTDALLSLHLPVTVKDNVSGHVSSNVQIIEQMTLYFANGTKDETIGVAVCLVGGPPTPERHWKCVGNVH